MGTVTSRDGTSIAYDRRGSGPAVVLVGGATVDRAENTPLAEELAAAASPSSTTTAAAAARAPTRSRTPSSARSRTWRR